MSQEKITRKNKETVHKPYRSNSSFYTDYRDEIPDADYYGLKHSEFKKPWLPASGYDNMEYRWDFPLEYLNPITVDFEVPDMGKYQFPGAPTVNPNWESDRWNPQYPTPDFPNPKQYAKKKPGESRAVQIAWTYCEGKDFEYCPGETVAVQFTEYTTDPIESADAGEGEIVRTSLGRLGESKHRPGYPEGTFTMMVKIPETAGRDYTVTATTKSGETCVSRGTQRSSCLGGCEGVSIGYTTLQMLTGSSQTLTVNNADPATLYEWSVTGGGSTTEQKGTSTVFTAPEANPDCANTPTISIRNAATGEVCATLKIGVSSDVGGDAYVVDEGDVCGSPLAGFCNCRGYRSRYNCAGTLSSQIYIYLGAGTCYWHPTPPAPQGCPAEACTVDSTPTDIRTVEQKAAGCCPEALM